MFSTEETKGLSEDGSQEYRNTLEKIISLTANLKDSDNKDAIESILGDSGRFSEAIKNLESTVSSDRLSSDDELKKLLEVSRIIEEIIESNDPSLMLAELLELAPVAKKCFDNNIDFNTLLAEYNESNLATFHSVSSESPEDSVSTDSESQKNSSPFYSVSIDTSEFSGSTDLEPQKNSSLLTRLYNFTLSTTPRRIATLLAFIFVASAIAAAIYFSGGLVLPFLGLIAINTSPMTLGLIFGALGLSAAGLLGVKVWPNVDKRGGGSGPDGASVTTQHGKNENSSYTGCLNTLLHKLSYTCTEKFMMPDTDNECGKSVTGNDKSLRLKPYPTDDETKNNNDDEATPDSSNRFG